MNAAARVRLTTIAFAFALALPALAQEAPTSRPAPQATTTQWETSIKGKVLGAEIATTAVEKGVVTLTTRGNLGGRDYTSTITTSAGKRLVRSVLKVQGAVITAARTPKGIAIKVEAQGQKKEQLVPGAGPFLVLENMVFSTYDLLTRYAVSRKEAFEFTLVVPSRLLGVKARFVPGKTATATLDKTPVAVRWGRLTVASLQVEVAYDPTSGACYGVRIQSQQIDGYRKGFRLPKLEALPAPVLAKGAREVEIKVENPLPGSLEALPGTLTLPAGDGPFPVAVFVQGSGASDRDETIGPNKPFRDLAYGLAAAGIASIRYDKRNWRENHDKVIPPERWKTTLREESILDALAALKLAASKKELGPRFVVGHSLGALAAPYIAKEAPGLTGIALLAGPGRPMDVLLREQQTYQLGLLGKPADEIKGIVDKALAPVAKIRAGELKGKEGVLGASAYYWSDILARDAPKTLKSLTLPVLVLQGAKDCQVLTQDYEALVKALKTRPATTWHEAKLFPNLNHLFMTVDGKSTGAEYGIESRVDPAVIKTLAAWIQKASKTN